MVTLPCYDRSHVGNSAQYHTGKACKTRDCDKPAGTWWSPDWCVDCNVERTKQRDAGYGR